ncbi:hypothetical protein IBB80_04255 [Listeria marthii]|uniref:hypothetical protein n=1 Tax=Listeria marthii TaxID=529731 RepID=UPI0016258E56|nr:hypothetical protein [Listeria marthii]MBC2062846.1 hypothetical protein [Listeria marthii]MBF2513660.1 hypothetical protein [Listeria marthii]MBF2587378.1 hypothetical protein [Listeria marthii]MBF2626371.1 hypothetical protein [Listeria marthii]MBF2674474.1 hypothetical protein [Listeria marthii]
MPIDYPATLGQYTREVLIDNDISDRDFSLLSKQLQTKFFELDGGVLWNAKALKITPEWIHQKWTRETN